MYPTPPPSLPVLTIPTSPANHIYPPYPIPTHLQHLPRPPEPLPRHHHTAPLPRHHHPAPFQTHNVRTRSHWCIHPYPPESIHRHPNPPRHPFPTYNVHTPSLVPSIPTQFVCSHPIPLNVPICCHSNATLQTRNVCTPSLTATSIATHPIPSVVTRTNQCPHSLPRNHHTVHQYTMYVPPSLTAAQLY